MAQSHDRASGFPVPASAMRPGSVRDPGAARREFSAPPTDCDPLSEVLRTVKLTGAVFFAVEATSPWGVAVPAVEVFGPAILPRAQHVVSYHIVLSGSGYARVADSPPVPVAGGDIIVIPHGDPYAIVGQLDRPPEYDEAASVVFLREMAAGRLPFVVEEGGGGPARAQFVCGFLGCDVRPFNPLVEALPAFLHVGRQSGADDDLLDRLVDLTLAEARTVRPGAECIRLGLSELIFVEVARRHVAGLVDGDAGWLAALRDPLVGHALALLHAQPAHAWSLAELTREIGASRSVLAARFTQLVGRPPMQYLTHWRMQLAARRLADGHDKVAAVGRAVGYESESAFSRGFKRVAGMSPAAWRARHQADG